MRFAEDLIIPLRLYGFAIDVMINCPTIINNKFNIDFLKLFIIYSNIYYLFIKDL